MWRLFVLFGLLCPWSLQAAQLPQNAPVPGGVVMVDLGPLTETRPEARYDELPVAVKQRDGRWQAVIGIPLSAKPGEQQLTVQQPGGSLERHFFTLQDKQYTAQYITLKNKRHVNPNPQDLERIYRERDLKRQAMQTFRSVQDPDMAFDWPVIGRISGEFGKRRFFNKQPRKPHSGLDIAVPKGTPVKAPADGRVVLTNDFFFSGNCIYIEHGQGLISFYAHLDKIAVKDGQEVKKGEIIGQVGATGRVTGPHLHWGVSLNRAWVDPMLFVDPAANGHLQAAR